MEIRKHLVLLLLCLAIFSCRTNQSSEKLDIDKLTNELASDQRYLSPEEVSDIIINEDPSYKLIDVRSPEEFMKFSLPGSKNVVWESIPDGPDDINCEKFNLVFFSNNDILSERAWFLVRQSGCKKAYILKGGLNGWIENILQPVQPAETASSEELELYQFRLAARNYFTGLSTELRLEPYLLPAKKKSPPKVIKKKEEEEERRRRRRESIWIQ